MHVRLQSTMWIFMQIHVFKNVIKVLKMRRVVFVRIVSYDNTYHLANRSDINHFEGKFVPLVQYSLQ